MNTRVGLVTAWLLRSAVGDQNQRFFSPHRGDERREIVVHGRVSDMAARFSQQTVSHFNGDAKIEYDCRVNVLLTLFNCDRYRHSQRYTIQANVNR